MAEKTIPVYMFLGFLEAGKTTFVQRTLDDERFAAGDNILLLVCEEGVEEYDVSKSGNAKITMKVIDDVSELTKKNLDKLVKECGADCVVIEYNGMWSLGDLVMNMPEDWNIFQVVMVADAATFMQYSTSFRPLVIEKINFTDLVVFNRYEGNAQIEDLHKAVRTVNRRVTIYYESDNGEMKIDDIVDPMPFDMNAPVITISDEHYGLWFSDIMENTKNYDGRKVNVKMMIRKQPRFPKGTFAVGRYIMNCCAEDIQFAWIAASYGNRDFRPRSEEHWVNITAGIKVQHDKAYNIDYPVMDIYELKDAEPPAEKVVSMI